MLDMVSNLVTALKHDNGMTHLTPPQFRCEDVRAMGTAESMFCLAVLGKCQRTYLGTRRMSDLIHVSLCFKPCVTLRAFDEVFRIVVLGNCQQEVVVHVRS